ncbi:hypothetical protein ILT44_23930 [Microvirga sp. BT689]|uniref:hypothetical protein n=1 Tax=Microvirga arvi TaxID=2778731 RepID=UPI001951ED8B|nr:hypothetical protein [Microvirga arvi]MBM6583256.1 hypothetical protein [Microvirga arvi]
MLGINPPEDIRRLIAKHQASLRQLGGVALQEMPGDTLMLGAYLNTRQAAFIAAKVDTPKAVEITLNKARTFAPKTALMPKMNHERFRRQKVYAPDVPVEFQGRQQGPSKADLRAQAHGPWRSTGSASARLLPLLHGPRQSLRWSHPRAPPRRT